MLASLKNLRDSRPRETRKSSDYAKSSSNAKRDSVLKKKNLSASASKRKQKSAGYSPTRQLKRNVPPSLKRSD